MKSVSVPLLKFVAPLLVLFLFSNPSVSNSLAQDKGKAGLEPISGLEKAIENYAKGNYAAAAELFGQLRIQFPQDSRYSIFEFMLARSHHKMGDLDDAEREFEGFVKEFPNSSYIGEALLLLGDIRFGQSDYFGAAYYYIQSFDRLKDEALRSKARLSLGNVIEAHITLSRLDDLAQRAQNYQLSPEMLYLKAGREARDGKSEKAASTIAILRQLFPSSEYAAKANQSDISLAGKSSRIFRIGVLAPLSGRLSSYGIDMLRGIKLALIDFQPNDSSFDADLEIYDDEGTQPGTIRGMEELSSSGVDIIIGPLESENAFCASIISKYEKIPMVVPIAAASGITAIAPNIIQLTPNSEYLGKMMANYAVLKLGIKQFAIISPNDDYGDDISAAFSQEVSRLGGEIVKVAFYQRGITDFQKQLTDIKEVLTAGLDTLIAKGLVDGSQYMNPKNPLEMLPVEEWPVMLGGLFIPGDADEAAQIAPQVAFAQIKTTLLGTEGWADPGILNSARGYLDGAIFVSDFYHFDKDLGWQIFSTRFKDHYAVEPSAIASLSYDAAMIALKAASEKSTGDIATRLSKITGYKGVSGTFTLSNGERSNSEVVYCKIINGEVVRAGRKQIQ
ncbi:MAG: hypothetical protein CO189_01195 [candidate division Zixibacteria bacterium CG_4_9_14_3_um_filter_46_8]|nr:MAG: hypothetical protein CO189_01195 [candidate division Zixibacteria bacterium CG_4_9_14_3_um_filter_46_8]